MASYEQVQKRIRATPRTWLVTGAAGFIGSPRPLETLLASLSPQPPILGAVSESEPEGSGLPILSVTAS
jgi:hypothetical protein